MKRMGFRSFIGILSAFLALMLMLGGTALCGQLVTMAMYVDGNDSEPTKTPETTIAPETTRTPETTKASETTKTPETTRVPETTKTPETTKAPEIMLPNFPKEERDVLNYDDMKAMWISQFDMKSVYCVGTSQRPRAQYTVLVEKMLDNVKANGFNTVILQMRPYADSMYPSEYYPASSYACGAYGKGFTYDPIEIFIELAHERGLSIHAWINPMRGMLVSEIGAISNKYLIKQWYTNRSTRGRLVCVVDNRLYLNPAYAEVRGLIIDGAREILEKYQVDGLHMDDYFYPTTAVSFDSKEYNEYWISGGRKTLTGFRREKLNKLVSGLWSMTKSVSEELVFGISPAGIMSNVTDKQYADVIEWCSMEGYIDYICPQVYFGLEHQSYDFVKVCNEWQSIIKTDSVKLVIGMSLGKAKAKVDNYAGTGMYEWREHDDILKRCLEYTKSLEKCTGVSYFCYQYFYDPISGREVSETAAERKNFLPVLEKITWNSK